MGRFVVRQHRRPWGTRFTFLLLANNSEPLCQSEVYNSLQACLDGIESVKAAAPLAATDLREVKERQ